MTMDRPGGMLGNPPLFTIANTPWKRLRGLLRLPEYEGVLAITPCHDVHTWGMREPIDIAFVDMRGLVLASYTNVQPRQRRKCPGAVLTLERRSNGGVWPQTGESITLDFE